MWAEKSVFYQIYPLGFCGAPFENDRKLQNRISKVTDWEDHLKKLGIGAIYFSPVFQSSTHGYDTEDFLKIDNRLGTNEDFAEVCRSLHEKNIRVVLDGVFNHVGRNFWAFQDVLKNRESSPYKDWFFINFGGNSCYDDHLWYEGWEGHFELVKLNLNNPAVVDYLFDCIAKWVEWFDIDGLRLDVAYLLPRPFLERLRGFCNQLKPDFFLVGELLHGMYNEVVNDRMLHSCTNYECYKGLYSAHNSYNLFEICHSLGRQFGPDQWSLYKGLHLMCFADNHDVTRVASILQNKRHLGTLYTILFTMPGIPCLYYGSEWGAEGDKSQGDPALRPCFDTYEENDLFDLLCRLSRAHSECEALYNGDFKQVVLQNRCCAFMRQCGDCRALICINIDENPCDMAVPHSGPCTDLLTGETVEINGSVHLEGCGFCCLKL